MKHLLIFTIWLIVSSVALAQERLEIIQLGHPVLRAQALEVSHAEISTPEFQKFLDDMIFTMKKAGGVGLAAPQVNKSLRVFVMKAWPSVPLTVVINPRLELLPEHGQRKSTEGCLSIPGKSMKVQRYKRVHLTYLDRNGEFVAKELVGFGAIIAQHEFDHLNGVLIIDLIQGLSEELNFEKYFKVPLM